MLRTLVVCALLVCALGQAQEQPEMQCTEPDFSPLASLDLSKFEGIWHEVASTKVVKETMEKDCVCPGSNYTHVEANNMEGLLVEHSCHIGSLTGPKAIVRGDLLQLTGKKADMNFMMFDIEDPRLPQDVQDELARMRRGEAPQQPQQPPQGQPQQPGQSEETKPPTEEEMMEYRKSTANFIIMHNDYETAIIVGPCKELVWILAKDPQISEDKVDALVTKARELGIEAELTRTPTEGC